jgi:hypothetical protein
MRVLLLAQVDACAGRTQAAATMRPLFDARTRLGQR